jgi:hypothetical protein
MKEHEIGVSAVPGRLAGRLGGVALASFALLVPLTMWLGFSDGVEFPKQVALRLLALVLALAVFSRAESRSALLAHPLAAPLSLLSLVALASTVFAGSPSISWAGEEGSWKGSSALVAVWLGSLCAGVLAQAGSPRKWGWAVLVSAGIALGYGMVQAAGLDPVPWDPGKRLVYWIMATLGNPVHFGNYLVCAFFLSLAFFPAPSVPARLFRVLVLAGIVGTLSRSALVSLGAGLAVWLLARRRPVMGAGPVLLAAAPAALLPFVGQLERLFSLTRVAGARPQIWEVASRMSAHHPLLGVGPDYFYSAFPRFAGYGFFMAEPPVVLGDSVFLRLPASAHSEIFDTVSMLGWPALGLYAWALVVVAVKCRKSPLLPALVALWVGHQVNPSSTATSALFWTMAAAGSRAGFAPKLSVRRGLAVSGLIAAVLLASLASSLRLAEAQAYRRESGRLLFMGDRAGAAALQGRWGSLAGRAHSRQLFEDGLFLSREPAGENQARELLARAVARNPWNLFYVSAAAELDFNGGVRRRDRAMLSAAEAGFRHALELAPAALSLHDDLARVLEAQGRRKEAQDERRFRRESDPRGLFAPRPAGGVSGK